MRSTAGKKRYEPRIPQPQSETDMLSAFMGGFGESLSPLFPVFGFVRSQNKPRLPLGHMNGDVDKKSFKNTDREHARKSVSKTAVLKSGQNYLAFFF